MLYQYHQEQLQLLTKQHDQEFYNLQENTSNTTPNKSNLLEKIEYLDQLYLKQQQQYHQILQQHSQEIINLKLYYGEILAPISITEQ